MATETSDDRVLELLRSRGALNVPEIAAETSVTATAVRQRLTRLMGQGLIERQAARRGRGRPSHRYSLTEKARRQVGSNFADLAITLWQEIRAVRDPQVRRGLLSRIANSLSACYSGRVRGVNIEERMASLAEVFAERRVAMSVSPRGELPVLSVNSCPYPELAEMDRSVCAMEKMLFSRLLEQEVRLTECRLDGHACCQFEAGSVSVLPG